MKIRILSDLHFEFHQDGGASFLSDPDPKEVDVLILAGDICGHWQIVDVMSKFAQVYKYVIAVSGNHEHYGASFDIVRKNFAKVNKPNFHFLDRKTVTIDGQRFVGCTLWFPNGPRNHVLRHSMNDFEKIKNFDPQVYQQNSLDQDFLHQTVSTDDVVITHHLPTFHSVHPKFAGNALNVFFVCDQEQLIKNRHPRLWCFGHTHESMRYTIHGTEIICNPFGYAGYEINPQFKDVVLTV